MAKVSKDFWGTTYVDVTDEVKRARRDERFQRDMGRVGSNLHHDTSGAVRGGAAGAAGAALGVGAVGYAAAKNLAFRYKLQAVLHFPFAYFVSFGVLAMFAGRMVGSSSSDQTMVTSMLVCMVLAVPISIVWSMVYIRKRTKPKLRAIGR